MKNKGLIKGTLYIMLFIDQMHGPFRSMGPNIDPQKISKYPKEWLKENLKSPFKLWFSPTQNTAQGTLVFPTLILHISF